MTPTPTIYSRSLHPPTSCSTPTSAPLCDLVLDIVPTPTPTITPSSSPSVFSPSSIPDLVGWFDASTGVTVSGGKVNDWTDLSSVMGNFNYSTGTKADYNSNGFGDYVRVYTIIITGKMK